MDPHVDTRIIAVHPIFLIGDRVFVVSFAFWSVHPGFFEIDVQKPRRREPRGRGVWFGFDIRIRGHHIESFLAQLPGSAHCERRNLRGYDKRTPWAMTC